MTGEEVMHGVNKAGENVMIEALSMEKKPFVLAGVGRHRCACRPSDFDRPCRSVGVGGTAVRGRPESVTNDCRV